MKKTDAQIIDNMIKNDRTFEVVVYSKIASVLLIKTTTKQRAFGFITRTQNLWREFDVSPDLDFEVFELITVKKGRKFIEDRRKVE